jgi:23S rRNA maturation-related 3'-5' exoribonuclease YhaM
MMKKTKMILELEKLFNNFERIQYNYTIDISGVDSDGTIVLSVFEKEYGELMFDLQVDYIDEKYELITAFINGIYEDYINYLAKSVNGWNAFIKRKTKSLRLWSERNDRNKVIEINNEMIDRYTQMEEAKKQSDFYKQFVYMFYNIRKRSISIVA